jgi:PAS domain S-box-containing protein
MRDPNEGFIALFKRLPIACMLTRASDHEVMAINPAFERLFGWRASEIIHAPSTQAPIWKDAQQREQLLSAFARDGRIQQHEAELQCRDGQLKPCLVYAELLDVDGQTCRLFMAHDISDRIASELALKRSEAKFTALFQDSPEPSDSRDQPQLHRAVWLSGGRCRRQDRIGHWPVALPGEAAGDHCQVAAREPAA